MSPQVIFFMHLKERGFPGGSDYKESAHNTGGPRLSPSVGKILWRREWVHR